MNTHDITVLPYLELYLRVTLTVVTIQLYGIDSIAFYKNSSWLETINLNGDSLDVGHHFGFAIISTLFRFQNFIRICWSRR